MNKLFSRLCSMYLRKMRRHVKLELKKLFIILVYYIVKTWLLKFKIRIGILYLFKNKECVIILDSFKKLVL